MYIYEKVEINRIYVEQEKKKNLEIERVRECYTVGENIIATIKMRNNFCYFLKVATFLYCSPFSYRYSNFAISKVVGLYLFA